MNPIQLNPNIPVFWSPHPIDIPLSFIFSEPFPILSNDLVAFLEEMYLTAAASEASFAVPGEELGFKQWLRMSNKAEAWLNKALPEGFNRPGAFFPDAGALFFGAGGRMAAKICVNVQLGINKKPTLWYSQSSGLLLGLFFALDAVTSSSQLSQNHMCNCLSQQPNILPDPPVGTPEPLVLEDRGTSVFLPQSLSSLACFWAELRFPGWGKQWKYQYQRQSKKIKKGRKNRAWGGIAESN